MRKIWKLKPEDEKLKIVAPVLTVSGDNDLVLNLNGMPVIAISEYGGFYRLPVESHLAIEMGIKLQKEWKLIDVDPKESKKAIREMIGLGPFFTEDDMLDFAGEVRGSRPEGIVLQEWRRKRNLK